MYRVSVATWTPGTRLAEGRCYYAFRCRSKAEENSGDKKRKLETTITMEIVVKRKKVEESEENDSKMEENDTKIEDMVEMENIELTETAETGDENKEEEEASATEKTDVTGFRGIFEVDSDEEEGDPGDPQQELKMRMGAAKTNWMTPL